MQEGNNHPSSSTKQFSEKNHDEHASSFDMMESRCQSCLFSHFSVYFPAILSNHLQKFFQYRINFFNFASDEHSDYCLCFFVIEHDEVITIFANHQIFRQLKFIELTLFTKKDVITHGYGILIKDFNFSRSEST